MSKINYVSDNIDSPKIFNFRKDIQGLRGLAVLLVVFYHSNFDFFKAGFIGVDIFFVISGYLIIKKILLQQLKNEFSLKIFYLKRVSRILPALYFLLVINAGLSFLIKHPIDNIFYAKSSITTLFFIPNFFYWKNINYFSSKTEIMHLIHTWSLGVEEQFYIFLPLFLVVIYRIFKSNLNIVLRIFIFLSLFSLAFYLLGYFFQLNATFYLLPFRLWEFLAGGIIAVVELKDFKFSNNYMNFLSIIFLLLCSNLLDPSNYFTNYFMILPVLFTGLIIINQPSKNILLLENKPLVFVGNISFSLYLFHQPLFAFAKIYDIFNEYIIIWLFLSFLISFLIFKFIEEKYRDYKNIKNTSKVLFVLFLVTLSINLYFIQNDGNNLNIIENYNIDLLERKSYTGELKFHGNEEDFRFIIFGDSHADHYIETLKKYSLKNEIGFISLTTSACISLKNIITYNSYVDQDCSKVYDELLAIQEKYKLDVIISQRWDQKLIDKESKIVHDSKSEFKKILIIENIEILKNEVLPNKLIVIGSVPGSNSQETGGYFRCVVYKNKDCLESFPIQNGIAYKINEQMSTMLQSNDYIFINPYINLCNGGMCFNKIQDSLIYYDNSHLSLFGSDLVLRELLNSQILLEKN